MTQSEARQLLDEFVSNTKDQESIAYWLNRIALLCSAGAKARGFHEDEEEARLQIDDSYGKDMRPWFEDQLLQAELARQVSELGEAVEAVRKPGPDHHCPQHSNFLVEEADCIIRIGDTCGKRGMDLGQAIVDKLLYNMGRSWKHGKNS